MTDYEPIYAEPREPRPPPRLEGARGWLVVAIVLILGANLVAAGLRGRAGQDPTLDAPIEQPTPAPTP